MTQACHTASHPVRIVGSAISPNGIGLSNQGMISIAFLDKVRSPLAF
jgi:hypothetical protein